MSTAVTAVDVIASNKEKGELKDHFTDNHGLKPQGWIGHERIVKCRYIKGEQVPKDGRNQKGGKERLCINDQAKDNVAAEKSKKGSAL
jgi:hypothetical protein